MATVKIPSFGLDIGTGKFTVAAATGNTVVAGTLGVTGLVTLSNDILLSDDHQVRWGATDAVQGNGTTHVLTFFTNNVSRMVIASTGAVTLASTLTTADPGAGAGAWKLGKLVTATSTHDTTRNLQVMVDGVTYKVALCT